jgi:hypothetical protein
MPFDRSFAVRPVRPVDRPVRSGLTYSDRYRYRSSKNRTGSIYARTRTRGVGTRTRTRTRGAGTRTRTRTRGVGTRTRTRTRKTPYLPTSVECHEIDGPSNVIK